MLRTLVSAFMLLSASAWAQSFEAASIKPSQPASPDRQIAGVQAPGGGRLNTFGTSPRMLITYAHDVKDFQITGGPGWANSETYDIVAKADGNATPPQLRLRADRYCTRRFSFAGFGL